MKHLKLFIFAFILIPPFLYAAEPFYSDLNKAQRFDLADAYDKVADTFENLGQTERAETYRKVGKQIFPDSEAPVPAPAISTEKKENTDTAKKLEAAYQESYGATSYYFDKLVRALNTENLSLTLSVLANLIYIPGRQDGIEKSVVAKVLARFFDTYNLQSLMAEDVFDMFRRNLERIPNNTWRLAVPVKASYQNILDAPFKGEIARFYFRKLPMGWRLIAVDTTS